MRLSAALRLSAAVPGVDQGELTLRYQPDRLCFESATEMNRERIESAQRPVAVQVDRRDGHTDSKS